jgi:hypothetical protein
MKSRQMRLASKKAQGCFGPDGIFLQSAVKAFQFAVAESEEQRWDKKFAK